MFGAQVILILKYKVSNCPYIKQNLSITENVNVVP